MFAFVSVGTKAGQWCREGLETSLAFPFLHRFGGRVKGSDSCFLSSLGHCCSFLCRGP